MAISIKSIPTLKDRAAQSFNDKLQSNNEKKRSICFETQVKSANKILAKAKMA